MNMDDIKLYIEFELLYIEEDLSDIRTGDELDEKYIIKQQTRRETLNEILSKLKQREGK